MIVALAGGVGAARFIEGLARVHPEERITIIVNTGDDIELYGLHISPDVDIITYTLAGIVDKKKGWGIEGDSFNFLNMLKDYGIDTWFNIGDRDLATHIVRTDFLRKGLTLSEATERLCKLLNLKVRILPMSNEKFQTRIITDRGNIHFQEYLVKRSSKDQVRDILFEGKKKAKPTPGVIESILNAELIIICPSNPLVSIRTILSVDGIEKALKETKAKTISITPLIGGSPIKGPLDKLMKGMGLEVSSFSIANMYKDFIDAFVLDVTDRHLKDKIESLRMDVYVIDTLMKGLKEKMRIAENILRIGEELKREE
ncbi:MAG: 2-phospho-L-lactate transferase [Candidatus Bathyarchaeota archaeon]|nr:2-phospho-L-lactate transferase [Candidatus Bathyarchaeota archaeon]